jgi:integrase
MPIATLNTQFVNNATCPPGKAKENYYDTAITGFILEVRATGGKTYALRYKDNYGRQIQHKIGDSKSISFDKARNAAQIIRSRVVLGENPSAEKRIKRLVPTLAEFITDRYLPHVKRSKRSPQTDESYLRCHILPRFGLMHMDQITEKMVVDFYHGLKAKGYAIGTANQAFIMLKTIFSSAIKWGIPGITANPTSGVKLLEANNARERYLSVEETQRLRDALEKSKNPQLKHIILLLLLLGCRKRELLDSRWSDFDLERRSWRIPMSKTGKARHVPLSYAVLEILAQLPRYANCPFLIPNPDNLKPYKSIFTGWDNARKEAGLPDVRLHDLRHSAASFMVNSGRSIYEVAKILGHSQLKTTERYAHLSQETLLAAVDSAADATGLTWRSGHQAEVTP